MSTLVVSFSRRHSGAHRSLRVGTIVSLCLHVALVVAIVLFIHGAPLPPPHHERVVLNLDLTKPAPPPPLETQPVKLPPTKPLPQLAPLPKPLPRPVVSRATAKKIPQAPPLPRPKPVDKPKLKPVPEPRPVTPPSHEPVVGHRVTQDYKSELENRIRNNLHYPRLARRQGRQGTALVRVRMKRDGTIESIELVKSSGSKALDREAQAVFRRIGQLPALPEDFLPKASEFQFEVPIAFKLVDPFG